MLGAKYGQRLNEGYSNIHLGSTLPEHYKYSHNISYITFKTTCVLFMQ